MPKNSNIDSQVFLKQHQGQRWPYDLKYKWTGFSKGNFYSESIQTDELNHSSELENLKSPYKSD